MRIFLLLSLFTTLLFPHVSAAASVISLPDSIGSDPILRMVETPRSWSPENMYEHVNGEAELLKRYGVSILISVVYENEKGTYLAADILDMGAPVNAFGLYRLYAGCDGQEYKVSSATVLSGDFTYYAMLDRFFLRIDFDSPGDNRQGKTVINEFLTKLSKTFPASGPLPREVELLQKESRKLCEISYNPEHIDYDLESGPGYSWTGPDGQINFISFFPSPDEAEIQASVLRNRGAPTVLVWGNAVTWPKVRTEMTSAYLKGVLRRVVKW